MEIKKVTDAAFLKYGKIVSGIDFSGLVEALCEKTPLLEEVAYEPSVEALEALPVFEELRRTCYGELPIQIGYCNGKNYGVSSLFRDKCGGDRCDSSGGKATGYYREFYI